MNESEFEEQLESHPWVFTYRKVGLPGDVPAYVIKTTLAGYEPGFHFSNGTVNIRNVSIWHAPEKADPNFKDRPLAHRLAFGRSRYEALKFEVELSQ